MRDTASMLSLPVTLAVITAAVLYMARWVARFQVEPGAAWRWRLTSFLVGLLVLWMATGSPLSGMDHHLLSFHMLQHLLVMNLSAPLLLLGAPLTVLSGRPPNHVSVAVERVVRSGVGRFFTHPCTTWLLSAGVVLAWHIPRVLELTLASPGWHAVQHASFFFAGLLFWWPVVLPAPAEPVWPRWVLPLYLFFATLPCDALAAFLAFSGRVVYPHYVAAHLDGTVSALADQTTAGALMWFVVTVGYLLPAVIITLELLSPGKKAAHAAAA